MTSSLCELFQRTAAQAGERVALRSADGATTIRWDEYAARVRSLAAGLHGLGVRRGDTVALMMLNRPEFHLCDAAAMHLGATSFSIYNTLDTETIAHVLANAGARVALCDDAFAERIEASGAPVDHLIRVDAGGLGALEAAAVDGFDFEASWRAVGPEDVLTLIYTSGTTGPPKGVELTHANMLAQIEATAEALPWEPGDVAVSSLPMAHVAERWASHYCGMAYGLEVTCVEDLRTLFGVLPRVRPTIWGSVPRMWEKLYAALQAGFAAEPDEAKRQAIAWAVDVGTRAVRAQQAGELAPELLAEWEKADELVLSAVRAKLGLDRVRWTICGAAATPLHILEFFAAIGLPICELWGMSELSCVGTTNRPDAIRLGTVGPPIPGVELSLADDGELLVRGPTVMRGYRGEPERTAEAIDADGWLHTGDVGRIDADGFLTIVDRKKELIINAAGKNMSPVNIEAAIKSASPLIGQAVAIGDGRPYNVALITLDPDATGGRPAAELADQIAAAVAAANERLARVEQIKRHVLLDDVWEPGGGELTPTMKLRRKPIAERYRDRIEALYADG